MRLFRFALVAFACLAVLAATYAASPFISLYQMVRAMRHHDMRTLTASIDWDSVRDGLKQDIADGIAGQPVEQVNDSTAKPGQDDDLPPFGASFVSNMAGNVVDRTVTPEHLAETINAIDAAHAALPKPGIGAVWFGGPSCLMVSMPAGPHEPAIRLELDLVASGLNLRWKITRAWLPEQMLERSETHNS
jgi:hypothetical protein